MSRAFQRVYDRAPKRWTAWMIFVTVLVGPITALPIIYAGYRIMAGRP